jgi:hypothetical protein
MARRATAPVGQRRGSMAEDMTKGTDPWKAAGFLG